jgi:tricorn protease
MYGRLTLSQAHIVFGYAGDLWSVEKSGGEARPLTTHPGEEGFPTFSPDGTQLAFSRQVGNNWDVYVMPAGGGEARRLTHHPQNDLAYAWTPDGKMVLIGSNRSGIPRLYTISVNGGMPTELPLPQANIGSFSADASRIAYTPTNGVREWRYYRGGGVGQIWLASTRDGSIEKFTSGNYNDDFPMWMGNKVYFVSDRTGIFNLYCTDLATRHTKQLTAFEKFGIRWAGSGPGAVVFVRDGRIHLHDTETGQTRIVDLRLNAEAPELKSRTVNASRTLESATLSRTGDRLLVGARGDVLMLDPVTGEGRNVTRSSNAAERYPVLSPDGRLLAYFSDESGEYKLHLRPAGGEEPIKKISIEARPSFYRELSWSPDSKKLSFTGKRLDLWYADVETAKASRIDTSTYSYQEEWYPRWSPDGRWLVYSKHLRNRVRTVFIYDFEAKRTRQITDGRTHSELPVFDANGKYLHFASSANAGTSEFGWGVLNGVLARPLVARRLHAVVLEAGAQPPLLPNGSPNSEAKLNEPATTVRIDFDGIAQRIVDIQAPVRDYRMLDSGRPGQLHALITEWPSSPLFGGNPTPTLYAFDLARSSRPDKIAEQVDAFEVSGDGRRLLYSRLRNWFLVGTEAAPKPDEGRLELKNLEVTVEPRAEWKQIYHEAWRIMRDWFYDPDHHGLNLSELEQHYGEYLPSITRRTDLNALMNRMLGHVSVSHLGIGGGDLPPPSSTGATVALLGADYEIAGNRYRLKKVYRTTTYNSAVPSVAAPLDRAGAGIREGEYLLAVDGQEIDTSREVYAYFEGKGPSPIKVTVGPTPDGKGGRTLTIYPVPSEANLRIANIAEANRRRVEEASDGKVGYIYVGNYGPGGIMDFVRGLTGYGDLQGLIIDQRYNGGGITPDYLIEWLQRRPIYYYHFREGDDIATPVNPGPRSRVLLVNEQNFSAAETFAFMYKLAKLGPIVGKRTGGGGIGPYVFTPQLLDGGNVQLPNRAAYNPDGSSWGVENVGVMPDYEVDNTPKDFMAGRDPQLEKAIQVAMEDMKKNPAARPIMPKYPVHK